MNESVKLQQIRARAEEGTTISLQELGQLTLAYAGQLHNIQEKNDCAADAAKAAQCKKCQTLLACFESAKSLRSSVARDISVWESKGSLREALGAKRNKRREQNGQDSSRISCHAKAGL